MNENDLQQEREISLFDLWEILREGWKVLAGGTALGLAGAVLATVLIAPKYEALAVVQVGQVGGAGQQGQAVALPVEPATQSIERMKTQAFQRKVAEAIGNQQWIDDLAMSSSATTKYISLQIVKATATPGGAPLIELKAKASTPDLAYKIADAAIRELARRQADLARPMIDKMKEDLKIAKERLGSAERDLNAIGKLVSGAGVKDERFTQLSLLTDLRVQKESDVFRQRQAIAAIETALMPPFTQAAEPLEEVFVSDKPVAPKKTLLLSLGLVGGLVAGAMWVFVSNAWRRARTERMFN